MAGSFGCSQSQLEEIYQMIRQPYASLSEPIRQEDDIDLVLGDTLFSDEPSPEETVIFQSMDESRKRLIRAEMKLVLIAR